ncbi:hypothetical protein V2G26_009195 [Clonostachys chloroleuca]
MTQPTRDIQPSASEARDGSPSPLPNMRRRTVLWRRKSLPPITLPGLSDKISRYREVSWYLGQRGRRTLMGRGEITSLVSICFWVLDNGLLGQRIADTCLQHLHKSGGSSTYTLRAESLTRLRKLAIYQDCQLGVVDHIISHFSHIMSCRTLREKTPQARCLASP